ncbi:MAG: hypothetical protein C5B55_03900 [Blastocatellia bacterium]|nr:MAG: hypothetical protein C5B55_03900 [Blastocatellia bacterium]
MPIEGTVISHYRVLSRIGAGGMGEVYLARDTKLDRTVALKILPADVAADHQRIGRFIQEAKTASALNHPNIITIYEIDQTDSFMYIATEFVEGETLRQHLNEVSVEFIEAIEITIQITSALAAAHEAGVVHRDIKPENLMIRRDGIVKVLDFGVAKLTDPHVQAIDRDAKTMTLIETEPGTILGTAYYMSPEQARGQDIDGRSDIWSVGVVLYEMITGEMPFGEETPHDVIAAILRDEPAQLSSVVPEIPPELERIVRKAMEKNREERYQGIKDLVVDLRRLKKQLDFDSELNSLNSARASGSTWARNSAGAQVSRASSKILRTTADNVEHGTSGAEYLAVNIKKYKTSGLVLLSLFVLAVVGVGYWIYKLTSRKSTESRQVMSVARFTSTGKAMYAAISPDGNYVAHISDEAGQQGVWIGQVAANSQVQILQPAAVQYHGVTFSRDGNFLYFVQSDKDNPTGSLFQIPALGGTARKILTNIQSAVALSPDGKRLAFVRFISPQENSLVSTNLDGSEEKRLVSRRSPDFLSTVGPAWSPDGTFVACVYQNTSGGYYENVIGVRVSDGTEAPITGQRWWEVGEIAWLSDGTGLVASATEEAGNLAQLWHLPYKSGDAKRITSDLSGYADVHLTADSKTLVAVRSDRLINVWVSSNVNAGSAVQITSGFQRDDGMRGLVWTPDGKIVYRSVAGGEPNIWMMKSDGTNQKQLTVNSTQNFDPAISPDGHHIVWGSRRSANTNLWQMDIDGQNAKQITNGVGEYFPEYTPDGQWVLFTTYDAPSGLWSIWKVASEGGTPIRLTQKESALSSISPDGKFFACNYQEAPGTSYKIAIVPVTGGQPTRLFDIPGSFGRTIHWISDGNALTYVDTQEGVSNIWTQSFAGGPPKQLTIFKDQRIYSFAWSRDGKQLAISRGVTNNDVVLIRDFQP